MNSWKEIARYLDRGVRTVQRWERELQLPVRRIGNGKRAPVYAVVSELKFWMVTSAGMNAVRDKNPMPHDFNGRKREAQITRLSELAQELAEASVRHQRQAEALRKNILALRSRFSPLKAR